MAMLPIDFHLQFSSCAKLAQMTNKSNIANSRWLFTIGATLVLLLPFQVAPLNSQTPVVEKKSPNPDIRCSIEVDNREWKREGTALITGTIENLLDGPLEVAVTPTLYLSRPSFPREDLFWAPVDVLQDRPLSLDKRAIGLKSEGVAIRPNTLPLSFKKGDSIHFRLDANHILWARTISSVWPSMNLFAVVKPGTYDVRLVLESERGESSSNPVKVVVASEPK